jgi:hypothetical protein
MSSPIEPICGACIHLQKGGCKAFPKGIPQAIDGGGNNHHKPFPGDHGIQFDLDPVVQQEIGTLDDFYLRDHI